METSAIEMCRMQPCIKHYNTNIWTKGLNTYMLQREITLNTTTFLGNVFPETFAFTVVPCICVVISTLVHQQTQCWTTTLHITIWFLFRNSSCSIYLHIKDFCFSLNKIVHCYNMKDISDKYNAKYLMNTTMSYLYWSQLEIDLSLVCFNWCDDGDVGFSITNHTIFTILHNANPDFPIFLHTS